MGNKLKMPSSNALKELKDTSNQTIKYFEKKLKLANEMFVTEAETMLEIIAAHDESEMPRDVIYQQQKLNEIRDDCEALILQIAVIEQKRRNELDAMIEASEVEDEC